MKIISLLSLLFVQGYSYCINNTNKKNVFISRIGLQKSEADVAEAKAIEINPKDAVKLFGRLAEKYVMLDSSGGMCCYSACSGEFKLCNIFCEAKFLFVYDVHLIRCYSLLK